MFRGAEAILYKEGDVLVKERIRKGYRIKEIDERLRRKRTKSEASLLRGARRIISVPQITGESEFAIKMEFIVGNRIKELLNEKNCKEVAEKIAVAVAKLHNYDIIHGDLTTSNMIMYKSKLYFIDFGLGFFSKRIEDKAIDLYLLHEALESTHFDILEKIWKVILNTYENNYEQIDARSASSSIGRKVIKTLNEIEKRGRYKVR